jgi:hypothetical protein
MRFIVLVLLSGILPLPWGWCVYWLLTKFWPPGAATPWQPRDLSPVGVVMGAPLCAALSTRLHGSVTVLLLAVALYLVGLRLLARVVA